jgi:hypothetical protein
MTRPQTCFRHNTVFYSVLYVFTWRQAMVVVYLDDRCLSGLSWSSIHKDTPYDWQQKIDYTFVKHCEFCCITLEVLFNIHIAQNLLQTSSLLDRCGWKFVYIPSFGLKRLPPYSIHSLCCKMQQFSFLFGACIEVALLCDDSVDILCLNSWGKKSQSFRNLGTG